MAVLMNVVSNVVILGTIIVSMDEMIWVTLSTRVVISVVVIV